MVLDSRDLRDLVSGLEERRATRRGRPGYGTKALLGMWIVKALYRQTTWAETARLVDDHPGLRRLLGSSPSRFACYRFAAKLLRHRDLLERCIRSVVAALRDLVPGYGMNVAIDSTDLSAYANGQKYRYRGGPEREAFSDPDASWGHRSAVSTRSGGGFYGYKLHMATCAATDLPVAWTVETAGVSDMSQVNGLLDRLPRRPEAAIMDAGYDYQKVIDSCWRHGIDPVIATRRNSGTRGGTPPDSSQGPLPAPVSSGTRVRPPQNAPRPRAPPRSRHRPSPTPRRSRAPHQTHSRTRPRTEHNGSRSPA